MLKRVLLVSMPFASVLGPSLALGLLKSLVEREGVPCDVSYLNIAFQAYTGHPDIYQEVIHHHMIGEWTFGEELFGEEWAQSDRGRPEALDTLLPSGDSSLRDSLTALRAIAGPFIQKCMDTINWNDYTIIGFTSVFCQQVTSLALARRIKQRWPDKIVAFGGANCDEVMGPALLRLFPFVDWVLMGEADLSFPQAVTQWSDGRPPEGIPGVAYRHQGQIIEQGPGQSPELDSLPHPDFDDYFAALKKWAPAALPSAYISLEFSRGCWWGEKSQCIFCGLNRRALNFRHKSPRRAETEIKELTKRYGIGKVMATDAILDMRFFKTLLPALAKQGKLVELFVETKANLNREQVQMLKSAGVKKFQPGIESLDTETLAYMHKGTTLLQNVQLLKWAREYGISPSWNLLHGFPGENAEAYHRMALLIPLITHLRPPDGVIPVLLQRFSPLFEQSQKWGLKNIRAHSGYRLVYPFGQEDLGELAYSFDYDFDGKDSIPTYISPVEQEVETWRQHWNHREPPLLAFERQQRGKIVIYDTRPSRLSPRQELDGEIAVAYLACDPRRQFDSLANEIREQRGKEYCGDAALRCCLNELVARRLMLRENDWYLSLANDLDISKKHSSSVLVYLLASKP